jgi:putative peptidoglycan lipid II flippase
VTRTGPLGPRTAAGLLASAGLIASVTAVSRVVGFGRLFVFSQTVGDTCLGTAYQSANTVPNVLFEVVAGGALAGVLVPVLTPALRAGDRERASRTASAALTWSLIGLVVAAAVVALLASPAATALVGGRTGVGCPGVAGVTRTMLLIFLPQVPLYGVAVVLAGALQAQHRFLAAAAAPLVSSLVVAASYLVFATLAPAGATRDLSALPGGALAVLAGGTTLGVLALAAAHAPALRSQITWRPRLRFPPGDGGFVRSLALAGLAALFAQQTVTVVATLLANHAGGPGAVNLWSYAWAMFLLPYAVLAVPLATSTFPALAEASADRREQAGALVARTLRWVLLACAVGAAVLAGTALPVAWVFVLGPVGSGRPDDLAGALVAFAPGLLGYGVLAVAARALYAAGRGRAAATATAAGWLAVLVTDLIAVPLAGPDRAVTALGLGNTIGMTLAGVLAVRAVAAVTGGAALDGVARAAVTAVAAMLAGAATGWAVVVAVDAHGLWHNLLAGTLAGLAALAAAVGVAAALDRRDLAELRRRLRQWRQRRPDSTPPPRQRSPL